MTIKFLKNIKILIKIILLTFREDLFPLEPEDPAAGELPSPEPNFCSPPPRTLVIEPFVLDMTLLP